MDSDRFNYWEKKNGLKIVETLEVHYIKLCGWMKIFTSFGHKFYPDQFYYKVMVLCPNVYVQIYRTQNIKVLF